MQSIFFFFNDTATTEIYTLSLHDALPIFRAAVPPSAAVWPPRPPAFCRSEEHTSELQSRLHLVCRLLLEKKKNHVTQYPTLAIITKLQAASSTLFSQQSTDIESELVYIPT